MKKTIKRYLKVTAITITAVCMLAACTGLDSLQRQLIFRPNKTVGSFPSQEGIAHDDVNFMVNGERVTGWFIPAKSSDAPAALYLHGSGFSLHANMPRILRLHDAGYHVLAIDYRGFGASDGDLPSEDSAYADAYAAWAELAKRAPNAARYIYGHSLGGAIAVDLASRVKDAAGLVIESSFTSVRDVLPHTPYRWIPFAPIQTQYFDARSKLSKVCMPTLVIHGTNDYRIPTDMARELYNAAPEPKQLVIVQGARHIDIPTRFNEQWRAALASLRSARAQECGGRV